MRKKYFLTRLIAVCVLLSCSALFAGQEQEEDPLAKTRNLIKKSRTGKFEIEVHYGTWSLNPIKSVFEDELIDRLSREIRKQIEGEVDDIQSGLARTDYEQDLAFDSNGSNYGLEIRFYPRGREGPFSLGLSVEKTHMRMAILGSLKQNFENGTYALVEANGFIDISPLCTNLSFRWDINPRWIVTPYFVFGLGIAPLDGQIGYGFNGTYIWDGPDRSITDSDEKSFKDAEEEIEFNLPNIFVLAQLHFGIRAELMSHLVLRIEGGIWDGIVLRGGIGYRF